MASGYFDAKRQGWVASFRGLHQAKSRRRLVRLDAGITAAPAAHAWAEECDRLCRVLEVAPTAAAVQRSIEIRAVTAAQGESLLTGRAPAIEGPDLGPVSLEAAALAHPSSRREPLKRQLLYCGFLKQFSEFSGARTSADITLDQVQRWVDAMRRQGLAWATRRHRLIYVRRACQMAAHRGYPDCLAGLRLDRDDQPGRTVEIWTLEQLATGLRVFGAGLDPRPAAVLILGGFLGLRPSEIWRATCGDLVDGTLVVGSRVAKNAGSRRILPLPTLIHAWLVDLVAGRLPDSPLVPSLSRRTEWLDETTATQLFGPLVRSACLVPLPVKCLRKSFATWAIRTGGHLDLVEAWIGHASSRIAAITSKHYLQQIQVDQLRPLAAHLDTILNPLLSAVRLPSSTDFFCRRRKHLPALVSWVAF